MANHDSAIALIEAEIAKLEAQKHDLERSLAALKQPRVARSAPPKPKAVRKPDKRRRPPTGRPIGRPRKPNGSAEPEPTYECIDCPKMERMTMVALKAHRKLFHNEWDNHWPCHYSNICDIVFTTDLARMRHEASAHTTEAQSMGWPLAPSQPTAK